MRGPFLTALVLATVPAVAQSPKPSFEVASIRPGSMKPVQLANGMSVIGAVQGGPGTPDPERVTMNSVSLKSVVTRAYCLRGDQVFGPDWTANTYYDITAKVPAGTTTEQYSLMLQDLLDQRFALKVHHENRDFKAYNLVVATGGLKLKDAVSTDGCAAGGRPVNGSCATGVEKISGIAKSPGTAPTGMSSSPIEGGFVTVGRSATMAQIAQGIEMRTQGRRVTDRTGISGSYDFRIQFAPPDVGATGDFGFASIFTAVEKDLGLKLEPVTISLDTLVVDKVERPTEN
ncbi:MAG TPA: TIGR03435 family protein [Bryobacteraceae bacterium]|jgi:uncharacterized protein (TIGR03435 family)